MKQFDIVDVVDIVMKLVGEVQPIGDSSVDANRFENLNRLTDVVNKLCAEIYKVSQYDGRHEQSVRKAGRCAFEFLLDLREWSE